MKSKGFLGFLIVCLFLSAACDRGNPLTPPRPTSPTPTPAPTPPTPPPPTPPPTTDPTLRSVSVDSAGSKYKTGDYEVFTSVANMSDGTARPITPETWTTDNPAVATVGPDGRVDIVGTGSATIGITYKGMTGAKTIQAFLSWVGPFQGTYRVDGCNATGDFLKEGFCEVAKSYEDWPIYFDLEQTGDSVSGVAYHGLIHWAVSGLVDADGRIALSGRYTGQLLEIDTEYEMRPALQYLCLYSATGTFRQRWTEADMEGFGDLECSFIELRRPDVGPGPIGAAAGAPEMKGLSLKDVIRALRKR